jgi:hypothetical protein
MNSAITHAKMGRLMKNCAIAVLQRADAVDAADAADAAPGCQGTGLTVAFGRSFWKPSTTTCSPAFNPSSTTHWPPRAAPSLTGRRLVSLFQTRYEPGTP